MDAGPRAPHRCPGPARRGARRLTSGAGSRRFTVATQHGKERVLAPPIARATGLRFRPVQDLDTNVFGRFDGLVPRAGTIRDAAEAKARAGAAAAGTPVAVASEGAYGAHPTIPFARGGMEVVAFVDLEEDLVIVEHRVVHRPVFVSALVDSEAALDRLLEQARMPSHAVMIGIEHDEGGTEWVGKGIHDLDLVYRTVDALHDRGVEGVRIASDMRAHRNPTRMADIREVAHALAERMTCHCPRCGAPGFGWTDHLRGLPCEACGSPTGLVRGEVHGCPRCQHTEERPRADGRIKADVAACGRCHP